MLSDVIVTNQAVKLLIFTIIVVDTTTRVSTTQTQSWGKTVKSGRDHTTTLQFYFHDTLTGKSPSAVEVAKPINGNQYSTNFGVVMMVDDPLTDGPDPNSKLVGRAQGLYGSACQDELALVMVLSYSFSDGPYKGSSVSIMGRNSVMHPVRELPVVGGTGVFRMGRGYALAQTYVFDLKSGNAIVGYNVTIIH